MKLARPRLKPASPEALALAGLWVTAWDLALAGAVALTCVALWAPPQDLPWTPLRLDAPVGMATQMKFGRAAADPIACRRVLDEGGVAFAEVAPRSSGGCETVDTVRLAGMALAPVGPVMTCPVALGYAFWMRHSVQPAARDLLGSDVARVDHYGTFACRNIYGRAEGRRSEHAAANALDVAGFRTEAGRRVSVIVDFKGDDAEGRFLRRVRTGACDWFGAVLSPDYNAAHRDHLHLDHGRWRVCR